MLQLRSVDDKYSTIYIFWQSGILCDAYPITLFQKKKNIPERTKWRHPNMTLWGIVVGDEGMAVGMVMVIGVVMGGMGVVMLMGMTVRYQMNAQLLSTQH
jgi:hypothetical protein